MVNLLYIVLQRFFGITHFQMGKSQSVMSREAEDQQQQGTHENIAHVTHILKENCRFSYRLIAEWMGIAITTVQQILCEGL